MLTPLSFCCHSILQPRRGTPSGGRISASTSHSQPKSCFRMMGRLMVQLTWLPPTHVSMRTLSTCGPMSIGELQPLAIWQLMPQGVIT